VRDVARLFVLSAQKASSGAISCGIRGVVTTVENFMSTAERVYPALKGKYKITEAAAPLPFPANFDESNLAQLLGGKVPVSSLETSISEMVQTFQSLYTQGRLSDKDLSS